MSQLISMFCDQRGGAESQLLRNVSAHFNIFDSYNAIENQLLRNVSTHINIFDSYIPFLVASRCISINMDGRRRADHDDGNRGSARGASPRQAQGTRADQLARRRLGA